MNMEKIKKDHRPLILVTNDDGVQAKGLKALVEAVRPFGDVVVIAPDSGMSGMSHAITVTRPLYLTKVLEEEGLTIFKSSGTPSDCVKLALHEVLGDKPDYLVSGINHGTNSSISMHYSGTVAGAKEGTFNAIPSIAFSLLDHSADADFSHAVNYVRQVFELVLEHGMAEGVCYNVNMPKGEIKGLRICRQAKGNWIEGFEKRYEPGTGKPYYWMTGSYVNLDTDAEDTDEWALDHGYAALVPFTIDPTCMETVSRLKSWGVEDRLPVSN